MPLHSRAVAAADALFLIRGAGGNLAGKIEKKSKIAEIGESRRSRPRTGARSPSEQGRTPAKSQSLSPARYLARSAAPRASRSLAAISRQYARKAMPKLMNHA